MSERATIVGMSLTAATAAASMFDRVLPSVADVRERPASPAATVAIRRQCARTATVVVGMGVGVSVLVRSLWPVAGVLGVVSWMWLEYEAAAAADGGDQVSVVDVATPARPLFAPWTS